LAAGFIPAASMRPGLQDVALLGYLIE